MTRDKLNHSDPLECGMISHGVGVGLMNLGEGLEVGRETEAGDGVRGGAQVQGSWSGGGRWRASYLEMGLYGSN